MTDLNFNQKEKMKFTKIKRLVSFGNHENISLEAEIGDGDDLAECHQTLLDSIHGQINLYEQAHALTLNLGGLQAATNSRLDWIRQLESQVKELQDKKIKIESWLSKFNISSDAFSESEIPF